MAPPSRRRPPAMRWTRLALLLGARCGPGGADVPPPGKRCHQVRGTCRPSLGAAVRPEVEPPPPAEDRRLSAAAAAPALPDENCLVATGPGGGPYLLGVGQNISLSPDQIMEHLAEGNRTWALVTIDGSTVECRDIRNESMRDPCAEYLSEEDCGWTQDYGCPGQPKGAQGDAADDGSTGFLCCCTQGAWRQGAGPPTGGGDPCDSGEVVDYSILCGLGYLDGAWGSQVCCVPRGGADEADEAGTTTGLAGAPDTTAGAGAAADAAAGTTTDLGSAPDTTAGAGAMADAAAGTTTDLAGAMADAMASAMADAAAGNSTDLAGAADTTAGVGAAADSADGTTTELAGAPDTTTAGADAAAKTTTDLGSAPDTTAGAGAAADAAAATTTDLAGAPDITAGAGAAADAAAGTTTADLGSTAGDGTTTDSAQDDGGGDLEGKAEDFGVALLGGRAARARGVGGTIEWASLAGAALLVAALAVRLGPRAAARFGPAERRYAGLDEAQLTMLHAGSSDDGF